MTSLPPLVQRKRIGQKLRGTRRRSTDGTTMPLLYRPAQASKIPSARRVTQQRINAAIRRPLSRASEWGHVNRHGYQRGAGKKWSMNAAKHGAGPSPEAVSAWYSRGQKGEDPRGPKPCAEARWYSYKKQRWLTRPEAEALYGKLSAEGDTKGARKSGADRGNSVKKSTV